MQGGADNRRVARSHEENRGEDKEGQEQELGEDEENEAAKPRAASVPIRPSASEVESHMLTHLPFRAWCPHCVRGKSKGRPHNRADVSKHVLPIVAIDYMFMHESQNAGDESGMPIIVMRDLNHGECGTGMSFAFGVCRARESIPML